MARSPMRPTGLTLDALIDPFHAFSLSQTRMRFGLDRHHLMMGLRTCLCTGGGYQPWQARPR